MRLATLFITLLSTLLLTGCQRQPAAEQQMENYLDRLARVLRQDWQPFPADSLSRYRLPERRDSLYSIPAERIGLLELLVDVNPCRPLQQRVAERNSVLGKVMPWSSRLAYEGELLRAMEQCLGTLSESDQQPLRNELSAIAERKRSQLPQVYWNTINTSTELAGYLRFADAPLPVQEQPLDDTAALTALQQLTAIGAGLPAQLPPALERIEQLLQTLQRSPNGSQLITALAQTRHGLQQATAMLQAQPGRYLCPMGTPSARSKVLLNVFVLFYAGEIQPYLAQLQRLGQPWAESIIALRAVPGIPAATAAALDQLAGTPQSLWEQYQAALTEHTDAWKQQLGACQSQPGQAGWEQRDQGNAD